MDYKSCVRRLFVKSGLNDIVLLSNRAPRVFCYHGVDNLINADIEGESLPVDLFIREINWLRSKFHFISIEEFDLKIKTDTLEDLDAVLTFDDGYESMIKVVDPILSSMRIPYTVFISTNNITSGDIFSTTLNRLTVVSEALNHITVPMLGIDCDLTNRQERFQIADKIAMYLKSESYDRVCSICDEIRENMPGELLEKLKEKYSSTKLMTWDQVRKLSDRGVTIGSHTCNHIVCHSKQNESLVRIEMQGSKAEIERQLQKPCNYFAFPNGTVTASSKEIARGLFSLSFSTNGIERISPSIDFASIPRISGTYNIDYFKTRVANFPKR